MVEYVPFTISLFQQQKGIINIITLTLRQALKKTAKFMTICQRVGR